MRLRRVLIFLLIFSLGVIFGTNSTIKLKLSNLNSIHQEKNTPRAFLSEVYDKIKENYWEKVDDEKLVEAFKAVSKSQGREIPENIKTKEDLIKNLDPKMAASISAALLASLPPVGRSTLYTEKQEIALQNNVNNVDPNKDLYKDLGVSKGASPEAVEQAFEKKQTEASPEELKKITYAKDVLTDKNTKTRYDSGGVEPTIFPKIVGSTLYLQFKKFSPTSLDEFQKAFEVQKDKNSDSLILDLRGNIGGAIDQTANFLGFFIGKNQSAFEFYHKGDYLPFRTPTDKIPSMDKYKQIIVLVDGSTQSSAEMMTASFKRYHLGLVLGQTTKGWGTVERVFPLDNQFDKTNKYSLFLVHSITLRDDNLPIEGRGVEPNINIKDPDWGNQLFSYFRNQGLIEAVKNVL